jgi:hypothetical protein
MDKGWGKEPRSKDEQAYDMLMSLFKDWKHQQKRKKKKRVKKNKNKQKKKRFESARPAGPVIFIYRNGKKCD